MRFTKTLLTTAAVIALAAPAFAQNTPGGPGERKNNQSPPMTATQSPAGAQPMTQNDKAPGPKAKAKTTGSGAMHSGKAMAPAQQKPGVTGERKANETPGAAK